MQVASYVDVAFGSEAAWNSFLHAHGMDHEAWYETTLDNGFEMENYPLIEWDEREGWLERHQRVHEQVAEAWGVDGPPNLQDWDLDDETQYEFWIALHAQEHQRMDAVMGLT